jgi:hypothetical protein
MTPKPWTSSFVTLSQTPEAVAEGVQQWLSKKVSNLPNRVRKSKKCWSDECQGTYTSEEYIANIPTILIFESSISPTGNLSETYEDDSGNKQGKNDGDPYTYPPLLSPFDSIQPLGGKYYRIVARIFFVNRSHFVTRFTDKTGWVYSYDGMAKDGRCRLIPGATVEDSLCRPDCELFHRPKGGITNTVIYALEEGIESQRLFMNEQSKELHFLYDLEVVQKEGRWSHAKLSNSLGQWKWNGNGAGKWAYYNHQSSGTASVPTHLSTGKTDKDAMTSKSASPFKSHKQRSQQARLHKYQECSAMKRLDPEVDNTNCRCLRAGMQNEWIISCSRCGQRSHFACYEAIGGMAGDPKNFQCDQCWVKSRVEKQLYVHISDIPKID